LQTLSFLRKNLMNTLKILVKAETQDNTVLNTKGTELTPKLSTDMAFPLWKLRLGILSLTKLSLKTGKGFWQPRGTPEGGRRHEE
jgi:hypothetical protein